MKIIFVTPEFVTEKKFDGGLSNYLFRVASFLQSLGHKVIIVVASHSHEVIFYKGIEVHRVQTLRPLWFKIVDKITHFQKYLYSFTWIWLSFRINKEVKNILEKEKIDIIQYPNMMAATLFRPKKNPAVVRLSGFRRLWDKVSEKNSIQLFISKQFQILEEICLKKADAVFAPSYLIAREVKNILNINVKVIRTPFVFEKKVYDYSIYELIRNKIKNKNYFLFFGTLSIRKGAKILGDIIYQLLNKYKDMYFVFVGKNIGQYNNKSLIEYIIDKAKEHKNRIIYYNKIEHDKLYPIVQNSKLVILPSIVDNYPNTCLEALFLKKIIVAFKNSSLDEVIQDGYNGFLADKKDNLSLLNTIDKAMKLSATEEMKMIHNIEKTLSYLNPEKEVNKLVSYYKNVIDSLNS